MPYIAQLLRSEAVRRALNVLKDLGEGRIEPSFDPNVGVRYPTLDDVIGSSEEALNALNLLYEAGILSPEIVDSVIACPTCQAYKLVVRVRCPLCNSSKLVKGKMIEHALCRYIDFEDKFKSEEGLVCPRCGKPLQKLGVDYEFFSLLYKCLSCKSSFSSPKIEYMCMNGHTFTEDSLTLYSLKAFKVNPEKRLLIEQLASVEVLLKPLRDEGFVIKAPDVIQGMSGVKHEFSFTVRNNHGELIAIGSLHFEKAASVVEVLAFWAKAIDVNAQHKIMVALNGLDDEARKLATTYGIKIIDDKSIHEASLKISNFIKSLVSKHQAET